MRIESINNYTNYQRVQFNNKARRQDNIYDINFKANATKPSIASFLKNKASSAKQFSRGLAILATTGFFVLFTPKSWDKAMEEAGYVKPLQETFETKEDAIDYAISRIVDPLNAKDTHEYSVLLDYNTYTPISERRGDSTSVNNYPIKLRIQDMLKIKHPYIALHGHPEEFFRNDRLATQTFSFQDFRVLNHDENRMETYVVKKDGRFCLLRKKEGFKQIPEEELVGLEKQFEEAFRYSWANPVDVYKNDTLIHRFYDYQGMHRFWKETADKYNLEYYTNYGVHEGVDAYSDYYYPELLDPMGPTSHRNFKL